MDKYELKMTIRELDTRIDEYKFEEAAQIADRVDWRKVKSVRILCKVSDVYKINRRYEDSKAVLELAHERYPKGRRIIFSLCELELKLSNYVRALQLYNEYINVAPKDSDRFVLQYKIYKAQNVSLPERIAVLEELSRHDFRDKWSFELAVLYTEAGEYTLAIAECDELIACYSDGKYVFRALELKKSLTKLTPQQQERFDRMNARYYPEPGDLQQEEDAAETYTEAGTGAGFSDVDAPPEFSDAADAVDMEVTVSDTSVIDEVVSDTSEDDVTDMAFAESVAEIRPMPADEAVFSPESLQRRIAKGFKDIENYDPYLAQETDGQYKMVMQDDAKPEKQITGQLDLSEIMEEWEKVRRGFYETNGFDPEEPPIRVASGNGGIRRKPNTKSWDPGEVHRALQIRDDEGVNFDTHLFVTEDGGEFPAEYDVDRAPVEQEKAGAYRVPYLHSEDSIQKLTEAIEEISLEGDKGNVVITGDERSGRLELARELVQRYRQINPNFVGQIVKVKGYKITRENLHRVLTRIPFGVLIVERAYSMSEEAAAALEEFLKEKECAVLVILIGRKGVMDAFLSDHRKLRTMFSARMDIEALSIETLVEYAREYAHKQNCIIDEFGVSALQSRIHSMQTVDHSVTLEDIRDLVDEAVYYAGRKTLSSIVDSISRRRNGISDQTVLHDKDFLHHK